MQTADYTGVNHIFGRKARSTESEYCGFDTWALQRLEFFAGLQVDFDKPGP